MTPIHIQTEQCEGCKNTFRTYDEMHSVYLCGCVTKRLCDKCTALHAYKVLTETGKVNLYLTMHQTYSQPDDTKGWKLAQRPDGGHFWYKDLKVEHGIPMLWFIPHIFKVGRHNLSRWRYDVSFWVPNWTTKKLDLWVGVNYGDNSQVCRCRRTKTTRGMTHADWEEWLWLKPGV